ncbi:putative ribonucleotide reductase [Corynebacterium phage P1201]|uniref:ribonucleoside-diphosphate reductase n=1 Tax=Corynebacterium phage P1201 TaxID=384848 RepID=A7IYE3_9CAUD|nr:ribonucleotide reductase class Ia beta subunit [Corynebacterium phage P1201]ABF57526.1 putative ribonucleotide reductase [Corynebacterium phage P1201]
MKQIGFMEEVHAKSYSSVFSTLFGSEDIDGAFAWVENNKATQVKKLVFDEAYDISDYNDRRVEYYGAIIRASSVLLESFLFYTGFYLPLHFASQGKLTNTADLIRLIMRDEGVHGYYLGYKFQKVMEGALPYERDAVKERVTNLACRLFVNEIPLIEEIYEPLGLSAQVQTFLRYNLNKAMQNLGLENVFPAEMTRVEPRILSQLSVDSEETHDFFSGSGSSYVIGQAEETTDDDWS